MQKIEVNRCLCAITIASALLMNVNAVEGSKRSPSTEMTREKLSVLPGEASTEQSISLEERNFDCLFDDSLTEDDKKILLEISSRIVKAENLIFPLLKEDSIGYLKGKELGKTKETLSEDTESTLKFLGKKYLSYLPKWDPLLTEEEKIATAEKLAKGEKVWLGSLSFKHRDSERDLKRNTSRFKGLIEENLTLKSRLEALMLRLAGIPRPLIKKTTSKSWSLALKMLTLKDFSLILPLWDPNCGEKQQAELISSVLEHGAIAPTIVYNEYRSTQAKNEEFTANIIGGILASLKKNKSVTTFELGLINNTYSEKTSFIWEDIKKVMEERGKSLKFKIWVKFKGGAPKFFWDFLEKSGLEPEQLVVELPDSDFIKSLPDVLKKVGHQINCLKLQNDPWRNLEEEIGFKREDIAVLADYLKKTPDDLCGYLHSLQVCGFFMDCIDPLFEEKLPALENLEIKGYVAGEKSKSSHKMSNEEQEALAKKLNCCSVLTQLDLTLKEDAGAFWTEFVKGLKTNTSLCGLGLRAPKEIIHNYVCSLAESLKEESSIVELRLRGSFIYTEQKHKRDCLNALAEALKENTSLINLDLSCNGLEDEDIMNFAEALKENSGLVEINLERNYIGAFGEKALADAMEKNITIFKLKL